MLKKIFKAAKKAAPIIGAGLGFLYGGPTLGTAIGGGLGSLVGGRSPEEALKFAAMSGLIGGGLSKFGGLTAGQGLGGLLGRTAPLGATGTTGGAAGSGLIPGKAGALTVGAPTKGKLATLLGKGIGWAKTNPIQAALTGLGIGGLLRGGLGDEEEEITYEKVYGTQNPFRDLGDAPVGGVSTIPFSTYSKNFATGGIAYEDDFPRRTGPIAGPGTETSDSVPAMLSDGEFVVNAKTVRGLGSMLGGNDRNDQRRLGSEFLYDMQDKYGGRV